MQETRPQSVTNNVAFNVQIRQLRENTLQRDQECQIGEPQMYIMLPRYQPLNRTHPLPWIYSIMRRLNHYANIFSNICQPSPMLCLDKLVLKLLDTMIQGETPKEAAASVD